MNRSYSKIRHMQKSNILLERRVIREQDEVGEGFLSNLFGGGKKEDEKDKDYSDEKLYLPMKESNNPNHELHLNNKVFDFYISDFKKFVEFCNEKGIYDIFLEAADDESTSSWARNSHLDDNIKYEDDWRKIYRSRDGVRSDTVFNIIYRNPNNGDKGRAPRDEIWYSWVDAHRDMAYPLAVYDEELKKYVRWFSAF